MCTRFLVVRRTPIWRQAPATLSSSFASASTRRRRWAMISSGVTVLDSFVVSVQGVTGSTTAPTKRGYATSTSGREATR